MIAADPLLIGRRKEKGQKERGVETRKGSEEGERKKRGERWREEEKNRTGACRPFFLLKDRWGSRSVPGLWPEASESEKKKSGGTGGIGLFSCAKTFFRGGKHT